MPIENTQSGLKRVVLSRDPSKGDRQAPKRLKLYANLTVLRKMSRVAGKFF
jgi:hypothetical protein